MTPRKTVLELFSTFAQFASDRFSHWATDPALYRRMRSCIDQETQQAKPVFTEQFWVGHWLSLWQQDSAVQASAHLSAYLQETCYWVTYRTGDFAQNAPYQLPDYFQLAIATVPKLLQRYNLSQGASLKTYASFHFGNVIRDAKRQQGEADSRTDWGLLRKVSQKRLEAALESGGLAGDMIANYRLAWSCFKIYNAPDAAATSRKLSAPDQASWSAIAQLYNQQRLRQHPQPLADATAEQLEHWLKKCASYIRAYLHPTVSSLNVGFAEAGTGELLDQIPDEGESPLVVLEMREETEERQIQRSQMADVLTNAIHHLKPDLQTLLSLYYRDGLTQQQLATQLETKQYTISRRLSSAKEALLLALAHWSQEHLHISLTSSALKDMSLVLEEWLQSYYTPTSSHSAKGVFPDA
uniref:Sigma-70 family RNA polymerase sigma factor n=1 Tax=Oscillatoriales cyanobacterium SpSt-402 TaxID=2282168 RepID=A0A832H5W7_9CYAN